MKIIVKSTNRRIRTLEKSGFKIAFGREHVEFPLMSVAEGPVEIHLIPIPKDWDPDVKYWAPEGFKALGVNSLVAVGLDHPNLLETMKFVATGAFQDDEPTSFPVYAVLGCSKEGKYLGIDGGWFSPFCLDESRKNLFGIFEKISE